MKNLYIVKGITSGEVNSPGVYRKDATINGALYSLIKTDKTEPTGSVVNLLSIEEFNANLDSIAFGGSNGVKFRKQELKFSEEIATAFSQAQSGLPTASGNALFNILANTSHRISRGQVTLAHYEFNLITDPLITTAMKNFVNGMFLNYFDIIPRDLT